MRVVALAAGALLVSGPVLGASSDSQLPAWALVKDMRGANNGNGPDVVPVSIQAGQADGKGEIVVKLGPGGDPATKHVLKFSAPTSKSTSITDFTNPDGLAKDLTIGYSRRWLMGSDEGLGVLMSQYEKFIVDADLSGVNDLDEIEKRVTAKKDPKIREEWKAIYSNARKLSVAWYLDGKLSYNKYDYFDTADGARSSDEFGSSLKAGISWPWGPGRASFILGYQRAFKESTSKAQSCTTPDSAPDLETCNELPLGAPEELAGGIAQFEYRALVADVVVSPMLSYDDAQEAWGVQLPIYLLRDKDALFSGGIRLGWRSDEERIVASVFVSAPLGFQ